MSETGQLNLQTETVLFCGPVSNDHEASKFRVRPRSDLEICIQTSRLPCEHLNENLADVNMTM